MYKTTEEQHEKLMHALADLNIAKLGFTDYYRFAELKKQEYDQAMREAMETFAQKQAELLERINTLEESFRKIFGKIRAEVLPEGVNVEEYDYDDSTRSFFNKAEKIAELSEIAD